MKRFIAYVIDYTIIAIIVRLSSPFLFMTIKNYNLLWFTIVFILYFWFWINDVLFYGSSIGKKIVRMKIVLKDIPLFRFATVHSLLKLLCSFLAAIFIIAYIAGYCKMPYDKWFYEKIE